MAKFLKTSEGIKISQIAERELYAIFKIQVNCRIVFLSDSNEEIDEISLGLREEENGNAQIQVVYGGNVMHLPYEKLIEIINSNKKIGGKLQIEIEKNNFKEVEPLMLMLDQIKKEIVNGCVSINYNLKDKMFTIIYLKKNNFNEKIFYFEENDSILAFTKEGPQLLIGKTSSIEDLICD